MHPPPTNLRDVLMLFAHWRPRHGAEGLFKQVNWARASRRQIIHAFLDRPPANAAEAEEDADFDRQVYALQLFGSAEFRANIPVRVMQAFPGKRRVLFVHIPKSAGTDFNSAIRPTLPFVHRGMEDPEMTPQPLLERQLNHFGKLIATEKYIFMGGHHQLAWYLDERLYRFNDRLIAIMRHPHAIAVSLINYIVHRMRTTPGLTAPDTRTWARILGLTEFDPETVDLREFALSIITRPGIQPVNPICSLLGDGTAARAFDNMPRAPIEFTSLEKYSDWLTASWKIERTKRENVSDKVISWDDLAPWQQAQIEAGCAEDRIIYEAVMGCLARSGGLSVTGPEVVAGLR